MKLDPIRNLNMNVDANGAEVPDRAVVKQDPANEADDELPDLIYNIEDFIEFPVQHGMSIYPLVRSQLTGAIQGCRDLNKWKYLVQDSDFMIHGEKGERFWFLATAVPEKLLSSTPKWYATSMLHWRHLTKPLSRAKL
jgi:hypothetical protein